MASYTTISVEQAGSVLIVTLNRPDRRNAVDVSLRDGLIAALREAESEPGLTVEIAGNGPAFCAGGDLDEFGSRPDPAIAHLVRLTRSLAWAMHQVRARTTVHLHGGCLGAGIELPAFADRVIAAPDSRIGLPEVGLGLIPGAGGTVSITRRIGRHRTAELALCGTTIDAETALAWGLVDEIADRR